jgi:hypothetical protein
MGFCEKSKYRSIYSFNDMLGSVGSFVADGKDAGVERLLIAFSG